MAVNSNFPVAGGTYSNRVSEDVEPNTEVIRSFNQPYADVIRLRFNQGVTYQTKNNSRNSGKVTFEYKPYDKNDDDSGGANNPLRWKVEIFSDGNKIYDEEFPKSIKIRI